MSHTAKLTAVFSLCFSLLSCKEEVENIVKEAPQATPTTEQPKPTKPKQSPLEHQVMLMLEGNKGDQKILRHAVETIEWKIILKTWKDGLKLYAEKHGQKPEKKHNMNAYRTLSLIRSELRLAKATRENQESLENLENTIKSAVEKERKTE